MRVDPGGRREQVNPRRCVRPALMGRGLDQGPEAAAQRSHQKTRKCQGEQTSHFISSR
jgi:hypothetical protein